MNDEVTASYGDHEYLISPPCSQQFKALSSQLEEAIQLISQVDKPMLNEINTLVSSVRLLNNNALALTSPKFFGAVYISMPNKGELLQQKTLVLVDHLVHETSHLFLNTVLVHDPLVLNDEILRYTSPIRKDPRPMLGIYHSVFVLSRVIRIFKKINEFNLYHDRDFLNKCTAQFIQCYELGYETVKRHGELTELGHLILKSTRACSLI